MVVVVTVVVVVIVVVVARGGRRTSGGSGCGSSCGGSGRGKRCRGTCTARDWAWLRAQKRPPLTVCDVALRNLERCATHAVVFDAVAICCSICSGSCCCVV